MATPDPFAHSPTRAVAPNIVSNPRIHNGAPIIAGTRIQAAIVADAVKHGASCEALQEDYYLTREQIQAALDFSR